MINCRVLPIALTVLAIVSCGRNGSGTEEPVKYNTLTLALTDKTVSTGYPASLQGRQMVEIRPQVSGTISRICIDEGQEVRKGQTLFIIDQVPYKSALAVAEAEVKSAEASLATARLTLSSKENLHSRQVISDYELQLSVNAVAEAEAALALAVANRDNAANSLSYTEVKSPVDGIAGMIAYRVGALVSSSISEPLVTVSDDSTVNAYFSMGESSVLDLELEYGSMEAFLAGVPSVELELSNGSMYGSAGRIAAVSGVVNKGTGAVQLRADFPNPGHVLRNGASSRVVMSSVRKDCIVVPASATYEIQDKIFVYKVVDGRTSSTEIKVSRLSDGTEYIVESGLEPGDVIIAEGAGLVREGILVATASE